MVVLKGIPRLLSPQLLSVLARMGHGDEIGIEIEHAATALVALPGPYADPFQHLHETTLIVLYRHTIPGQRVVPYVRVSIYCTQEGLLVLYH